MKGTSLLFIFFFLQSMLLLHAKKQAQFNAAWVENEMIKIPAGFFIRTKQAADSEQTDTVRLTEFYLQKGEMSNQLYLFYLQDLMKKKDTASLRKALPDTLVWRTKHLHCEPFVAYYFRHPAYRLYPLVGVTHDQAKMFCEWLTKTYAAFPKRKFNNVRFTLPSEDEWMYAASGGQSYAPFPWKGPFIRNANGDFLANHVNRIEASLFPDSCNGAVVFRPVELLGDFDFSWENGSDITAPSVSYWPNSFGLYNMAGNVEELVQEEGIAKGGSWSDYPYYLQIRAKQFYAEKNAASSERGFRIKMHVLEN